MHIFRDGWNGMSRQIVEGAEDVKRALKELPDKLRRRMLRNALAAGARIVRNKAQAAAPELARSSSTRTAGLLRSAIKVRTSKRDRKAGDVGVFVNVRPAPSAQRGAKSPKDPYYWQWLEFGRKAGTARRTAKSRKAGTKPRRVGAIAPMRFLGNAAQSLPGAGLGAITANLAKQVAKLNNRRPG
jgi:Bacteriophage HK97-gp10, putative tail-component